MSRRGALRVGGMVGLALAPGWTRGFAAPGFIAAGDRRITVEGRSAPGASGGLRIGYPGVAVRFRAGAARLTMAVTATSADCWIDIAVDGATPRVLRLAAGPQDIVLSDGTSGRRLVEVLKRTESWQGQIEIAGFAGARAVEPVPLPARKLLFIGDSITCGAGTDVPDANSARNDTSINDGAKSFGRVLARTLDAACHLVSYGGRGIVRDWQGIRDIANAPIFYERALPDDPHALWNPAAYVPDGVGICLGTNDFNQGVPDQNEFVNTYLEFLRKVMRDAPHAQVFVIDSPMTDDGSAALGHRRTIQQDYLDQVVARIDQPQVRRAHLRHYPGRAVNSHPIASEHRAMASELEPQFRAALRWA